MYTIDKFINLLHIMSAENVKIVSAIINNFDECDEEDFERTRDCARRAMDTLAEKLRRSDRLEAGKIFSLPIEDVHDIREAVRVIKGEGNDVDVAYIESALRELSRLLGALHFASCKARKEQDAANDRRLASASTNMSDGASANASDGALRLQA